MLNFNGEKGIFFGISAKMLYLEYQDQERRLFHCPIESDMVMSQYVTVTVCILEV